MLGRTRVRGMLLGSYGWSALLIPVVGSRSWIKGGAGEVAAKGPPLFRNNCEIYEISPSWKVKIQRGGEKKSNERAQEFNER